MLAVEQNKVLIPPAYNKYLSWGFSDLSVRVGNYDSDKASAIYENLDNGEILCAACPNARMVVTAGTSTVSSSIRTDILFTVIPLDIFGRHGKNRYGHCYTMAYYGSYF